VLKPCRNNEEQIKLSHFFRNCDFSKRLKAEEGSFDVSLGYLNKAVAILESATTLEEFKQVRIQQRVTSILTNVGKLPESIELENRDRDRVYFMLLTDLFQATIKVRHIRIFYLLKF
jgi:hypothetical protein